MPQSWPATLPEPSFDHKAEYSSGLADPEELINPERVRRLADIVDGVEFVFDANQMEAFKTFFDITCNGGADWFSAPWVSSLDASALWARFTKGGYESDPVGLNWRVACRLELLR